MLKLLVVFFLAVVLVENIMHASSSSHSGLGEGASPFLTSIPDMETIIQSQKFTSTGTTIVGLCCVDGVVLGADTRSTGGSLVMDKGKLKIRPIASRIHACGAGTSAVCEKIAEQARHELALDRIDQELSSEFASFNSVPSAVNSIVNALKSKEKASAVFIVGGIDSAGPKLYQIDDSKSPNRLAYGSLGSGCTDALAVLESSLSQLMDDNNPFLVNIKCSEAIEIVRNAVKAGILNDLGSGSHVDMCVITRDNVQQWRELMVAKAPTDTVQQKQEIEIPKVPLGTKVWTSRRSKKQSSTILGANDILYDMSCKYVDILKL